MSEPLTTSELVQIGLATVCVLALGFMLGYFAGVLPERPKFWVPLAALAVILFCNLAVVLIGRLT